MSNWAAKANTAALYQSAAAAALSEGIAITVTGYPVKNQCGVHPMLQKTVCKLEGRQLKLANGCETFIGGPGMADGLDRVDASKCKAN